MIVCEQGRKPAEAEEEVGPFKLSPVKEYKIQARAVISGSTGEAGQLHSPHDNVGLHHCGNHQVPRNSVSLHR